MELTAIAYALQLLQAIPTLLAAGRDVAAMIEQGSTALKAMQAEGRDPTPEEWDALNATIAALRAELHG